MGSIRRAARIGVKTARGGDDSMSEKWRVAITMLFAVLAAAVGRALAAKGMKATAGALADEGALAQIRAVVGSGHV